MSKFEQYRRNAEEAQRQADRANSDEIRAAWLRKDNGCKTARRIICRRLRSRSYRLNLNVEGLFSR